MGLAIMQIHGPDPWAFYAKYLEGMYDAQKLCALQSDSVFCNAQFSKPIAKFRLLKPNDFCSILSPTYVMKADQVLWQVY